MKRIFSIVAMCAAMVVAASMFSSCENQSTFLYNVTAKADGEGKIIVEYPTGNPGLVAEGKACVEATSTNDSSAMVNGFFEMPDNAVLATRVLENPKAYSKNEVKNAEKLVTEAENAVKFHAEGTWHASVVGYAKYDNIYVIIDEHFPTDTTATR